MKITGLGLILRGSVRFALAAVFSIGICFGLANEAEAAAAIKLSAPIASVTVNPGQTATYTVKIARNGYLDKVSLSATGTPAGTTVAFSPNLTTTSSSTMTVTTPTSITAGVYQIKVNALETATGSAAAPIFVSLRVNPPPIVTLTATPRSQSIVAGNSAVYQIAINRNTFTGPITLAVNGLPTGATASFSYATNSATLTINTSVDSGQALRFPVVTGTAPGASITPVTLTFRTNAALLWTSPLNFGYDTWPTGVTQDVFGNVLVISGVETVWNPVGNSEDVCKITKYLSNGTLLWTRTLDDLDQTEVDWPTSIVTDNNGYVYVAGVSKGRIDPSVFTQWPDASAIRWWLARFNPDGIRQWTRQDSQRRDASTVEVVLDGAQNPVLYFTTDTSVEKLSHRLVFDSNGQTLSSTANPTTVQLVQDIHAQSSAYFLVGRKRLTGSINAARIAKYEGSGALVWEKDILLDGLHSECYKVVSDLSGNVFAVCSSSGTNGLYYVLFRLDGNTGNVIWEKPISNTSFLRVHTDGDVLVGTLDLDNESSRIAKYDRLDGRQKWFRDFDRFMFRHGEHPLGSNSLYLVGRDLIGRDYRSGTVPDEWPGAIFSYRLPDPASLPSGLVINPPSVLPGAQITMWGNNLSNVEEVRVGTTSVQFTIVSATEIRFNLPNIASGLYVVSARTDAEYVPASLPLTVF